MLSISRHKTAIKRVDISRPVKLALGHGLIGEETTFFDYGCGYGDDVLYLSGKGIRASGWDPVHCPGQVRAEAEVVNLGYVVNVIEDPVERAAVLKDAWSLARQLLIVSARLTVEGNGASRQQSYGDGFVTSRSTFQKFYEQNELREWIDGTIGVRSVAAGPGVFYAFRDPDKVQSFAASQYRRLQVVPRTPRGTILAEEKQSLLEPLIAFVTARGRMPAESELEAAALIRRSYGSIGRAFTLVRRALAANFWERIREERSQDLLIYLALTRFSGRPKLTELPEDLRLDVREFFSSYKRACELADDLLFSAGRAETLKEAFSQASVGKRTPDALYVHVSALTNLSAVLRVYEGCARAYIGAVEGANVVKLHRNKPQVSYLHYPDFETDPHPALSASLIVPLDSFHIRYREYADSKNPFILHRKEEFLAADHPLRPEFALLTSQEEAAGLYEDTTTIGTRDGWQRVLDNKGIYLSGHKVMRKKEEAGGDALSTVLVVSTISVENDNV